jgi:hypothetical protein
MNALTILALAIATPIILVPVAFIWYVNVGGILAAIRATGHKVTAGA